MQFIIAPVHKIQPKDEEFSFPRMPLASDCVMHSGVKNGILKTL